MVSCVPRKHGCKLRNRVCAYVYSCIYPMCGFVFPPQPRQTLLSHYWMNELPFIILHLQAKKNKKKKTGFPPPEKRSHRFTGRLSASWISYLHWQQKKKRRFNYFGIDALVTQYRHLNSFCFFLSQSCYTLTVLCPRTEKKVGLLSSCHCTSNAVPLKRHRFSYKLCDCEWVGGEACVKKTRCPLRVHEPPRCPFNAHPGGPVSPFASTFCSTVAAGLSSGTDCSF